MVFIVLVALVKRSKAERSQFFIVSDCSITLSVTLMSKSLDLAIFVLTDKQTDRLLYPLRIHTG